MRVVLTGGAGMLARALHTAHAERGHEAIALDRRALDVTDAAAVGETLAALRPDVVIHCAAYTDVDGSEAREPYARLINADSARIAAHACTRLGARFVYPSTDYVFDGSAGRPYRPDDVPRPINAYGRSKLHGERAAAEAADWMIVRVAWLYGPERRGFIRDMIGRARKIDESGGPALRVVADQTGTPTWTRSAASIIARLLELSVPNGVYHATDVGAVTRFELAREALRLAGLEHVPIEPVPSAEFFAAATRPRYSALDTSATAALLGPLPSWRASLAEAIATGAY